MDEAHSLKTSGPEEKAYDSEALKRIAKFIAGYYLGSRFTGGPCIVSDSPLEWGIRRELISYVQLELQSHGRTDRVTTSSRENPKLCCFDLSLFINNGRFVEVSDRAILTSLVSADSTAYFVGSGCSRRAGSSY